MEPNSRERPELMRHSGADAEAIQYLFLAKPFSPLMRMSLHQSIVNIHRLARSQRRTIATTHWSFWDTLKATGPIGFTHWILQTVLQDTADSYIDIWHKAFNRHFTRIVGSVAFLPVDSGCQTPNRLFEHLGQVSLPRLRKSVTTLLN